MLVHKIANIAVLSQKYATESFKGENLCEWGSYFPRLTRVP